MIRPPSPSRGEAYVECPLCALAAPETDEVEGVATIGHDEDYRGYGASYVESFECENGHTLRDLDPKQEGRILDSAREWIGDALEALESAADDARYDSWRDDGR